MTLIEQFESHQGRMAHKPPKYLDIYDRHFQRFLGKPITLVEIGVGEGGSLQLWKKFFGSQVTVVGIDYRPECSAFEEDQIHVRIGLQQDVKFIVDVVKEFGTPDIVIDDASHRAMATCSTFKILYPLVSTYGMYAVEDVGTSYVADYGGGLRHPDSFVELTKHLIDEMHSVSYGLLEWTQFGSSIEGVHIYENLFIFEKHPYVPTIGVMRGGEQK